MKIVENITIGADPEVFIQHKVNGKIIPAYKLLPEYNKENPRDMGNGYAILHDNIMLEGNIPPASSKEEFITNMNGLVTIFNDFIKSRSTNLQLKFADSVETDSETLNHSIAKIFGCSPYLNAYKDISEIKADDMSELNARVAGDHHHIGYDSMYKKETVNKIIAKLFDVFVVLPARTLYNDPIRAKYYGAYGNYRNKPYGLEVRSLGGYFFDPKFYGIIYDNMQMMFEYMNSFNDIVQLISKTNIIDPYNIERYSDRIYKELKFNQKSLRFDRNGNI